MTVIRCIVIPGIGTISCDPVLALPEFIGAYVGASGNQYRIRQLGPVSAIVEWNDGAPPAPSLWPVTLLRTAVASGSLMPAERSI